MKLATTCALFLALFVLAPSAEAQVCAGAPSFRQAPMQVGVGAAFTEDAQGVGGHFALGGQALFGGAGISVLNYSDLDATQTNVSFFGGADLAVEQNSRVFVCPRAAVGFGTGPDIGPLDISAVSLEGGGSVGVLAMDTDQLMVVPTFGLAAGWQRLTLEAPGVDTDESDTYGIANLGVGFILNRRIGITPNIAIPFSAGDSDVVFNVGFTFNFGS